MDLLKRIIGIIITTFVIAAFYGFFCATLDFMKADYDPVASGRYAANHVYGLFGVVTEEINHNDAGEAPHADRSIARKIAAPYAVTADVAALLTGKVEDGLASLVHNRVKKIDK